MHVNCLRSQVNLSVIGVERHLHGKLQLGNFGNLVGDGVELCQRFAIGILQHDVTVGKLFWKNDRDKIILLVISNHLIGCRP